MDNFNVTKKIGLCFVALIVFFAAFGIYANYAGSKLNQSTSDVKEWTDALSATSRILNVVHDTHSLNLAILLTDDPSLIKTYESRLADNRKTIDSLLDKAEEQMHNARYDTEADKQADLAIVANERALWKAYSESSAKAVSLLDSGDHEGAVKQLAGQASTDFDKLSAALVKDEENTITNTDRVKSVSDSQYSGVFATTAISLIVVIVITVLCAVYLYRLISGSVNETLGALEKVANGDFRVRLNIDRGDEFGRMAHEFNKMLDNVSKLTKQIQTTATTVTDASNSLTNTADQSATATQNVAQSITEVAGAAQDQMTFLEDTKKEVDAFRAGIDEATNLLTSVVGDVQHTSQRANEGNKLVQATVDQMNQIADTVQTSAQVVAKLGERSKEIGDIVEVITGISGQTNLLALNAAIEAARAGEHGRGFAVVASEVSKLAEESAEASHKIGDLIKVIQEETTDAVNSMQTGRDEAERGRENVAQTGQGFEEILQMIESVKTHSETIQTTVKGLNDRAGNIAEATAKILDSTSKVASESQNISAASEEQAAGMAEIASSSKNLASLAADLSSAAGKFKT